MVVRDKNNGSKGQKTMVIRDKKRTMVDKTKDSTT
jgi:hypothetical protein